MFCPLQIPATPVAVPDSVPTVHDEIQMLSSLPFDEMINKLVSSTVSLVINVVIAVAVFYLGKFIIKKIFGLVSGILVRRRIDTSIASFVLSMLRIVLYFILIVTVIGILGIETSSFIALFASAGVAIGMALSGTLQNFAGGVLILLLKPYKIGDYIEVQGFSGTVREIQIFSTIICTADNKSIIIPNGGLSTGSVNNWSKEEYRRVDWLVGISYGDDVDAARRKLLELAESDPRILHKSTEEAAPVDKNDAIAAARALLKPDVVADPTVVVKDLSASSVDLRMSAWTRTSDYWGVYFDLNERIYKELPSVGVSFPFPQMDVHINN